MSHPGIAKTNNRAGMLFMIAGCLVFAVQDGLSRYLAENVSVYMIVMLRFWMFGTLALVLAARHKNGFKAAAHTEFPVLQMLRALLLIVEIWVIMFAFVKLGLIATHAVFVCYPLIVAALSVPILGEKVGWRRWLAIFVGFIGVLVIINPGASVISLWTLLPLASATMFAAYALLTRYVARGDAASVSFFWTGVGGAVISTPMGLWHWQAVTGEQAGWIGVLCLLAITGNWLLIKAYDAADASSVQPFAYMQFPFVSLVGLFAFGESLQTNVIIGASIVVGAGLFTLWRERMRQRAAVAATVEAAAKTRT